MGEEGLVVGGDGKERELQRGPVLKRIGVVNGGICPPTHQEKHVGHTTPFQHTKVFCDGGGVWLRSPFLFSFSWRFIRLKPIGQGRMPSSAASSVLSLRKARVPP